MDRRFSPGVLGVIAIGGAAGTLLRVLVGRALPVATDGFPWDTLVVNLAGSLLMGFIVVSALARVGNNRYFRPLLGTGLCGGLTTFSTFAVEVDLLIRAGKVGTASLYVAVSVAGGTTLAWTGAVLAHAAWSREPAG